MWWKLRRSKLLFIVVLAAHVLYPGRANAFGFKKILCLLGISSGPAAVPAPAAAPLYRTPEEFLAYMNARSEDCPISWRTRHRILILTVYQHNGATRHRYFDVEEMRELNAAEAKSEFLSPDVVMLRSRRIGREFPLKAGVLYDLNTLAPITHTFSGYADKPKLPNADIDDFLDAPDGTVFALEFTPPRKSRYGFKLTPIKGQTQSGFAVIPPIELGQNVEAPDGIQRTSPLYRTPEEFLVYLRSAIHRDPVISWRTGHRILTQYVHAEGKPLVAKLIDIELMREMTKDEQLAEFVTADTVFARSRLTGRTFAIKDGSVFDLETFAPIEFQTPGYSEIMNPHESSLTDFLDTSSGTTYFLELKRRSRRSDGISLTKIESPAQTEFPFVRR